MSQPPYEYVVDGRRIQCDIGELTGAQIREDIHGQDPKVELYLKGVGSEGDRLISDTDVVRLNAGPPPELFTVRPLQKQR